MRKVTYRLNKAERFPLSAKSKCKLVQALKLAETEYKKDDPLLADTARSALEIVVDMEQSSATKFGLDSLHDLIMVLSGERVIASIDTYLADDVTDCGICSALRLKLKSA